jgi:cytochrome c oxidase assembly protein subunit 11
MSAAREIRRANRRVALAAAGAAALMGALAFAASPFYAWFCSVTGFAGTTLRADAPPAAAGERLITVRFNADLGGRDLPWRFEPAQGPLSVRTGEQALAFFRVTNEGREPVVGTATFNVTPHKAAPYFDKIACFCFSEQELAPGESLDLPVSFFVDPAIEKDPNLAGVDAITLSYTFFRHPSAAPRAASRVGAASAPRAPVN